MKSAMASNTGADDTKGPRASHPGPDRRRLALGVLRRLASALEAVLLALLGPRVAGQQTGGARGAAGVRMGADQGSRDAVADRPGLPREAAAGDQHARG